MFLYMKLSVTGIFLLLMAAFCSLQANPAPYSTSIQTISYRAAGSKTVAVIQLSDGTSWNFMVGTLEESLLADLEANLPAGKEVFIWPYFHEPWYRLYFLDIQGEWMNYRVGMTKDTKLYISNKILKIEKVLIKKGGWFTSDVFGYHICLTDGSVWDVNESSKGHWVLKQWKPNDKIIVVTTQDDKSWSLVNIDTTYQDSDDNDYRLIYNVFLLPQ